MTRKKKGQGLQHVMETASHSESGYLKSFLIIALNTGMRRSEILSLKWENVNFAKRFVLIEDSKNGRSRKVPINEIVIDSLKKIDKIDKYVFFNAKTKTRIKEIKTSFITACRRAEIKGVNIHALRHTSATKMINDAGVDIVTAGKILGHSSIKMTLRYCHPSEDTMQKAVDKLGEIFESSIERDFNELSQIKSSEIIPFFYH